MADIPTIINLEVPTLFQIFSVASPTIWNRNLQNKLYQIFT